MAEFSRAHRRRLGRPATLENQERETKALALWLGGATLTQIAAQLQWAGTSSAKRAVDRARYRLVGEPVEQARKDDLERLRRMLLPVFLKALAGDLEAIDRVLAILTRRAKLLGLDVQRDTEMVKNSLALTQNHTQVNVLIQIGDGPAIPLEDWRRKAIEGRTDGNNPNS